jgi:hypothetical protein
MLVSALPVASRSFFLPVPDHGLTNDRRSAIVRSGSAVIDSILLGRIALLRLLEQTRGPEKDRMAGTLVVCLLHGWPLGSAREETRLLIVS